jgi:hypothetical protein
MNINLCLFTILFVDGYLGYFHYKTIVAVNLSLVTIFNSSGYITGSGIAGSHSNSIINFLRNCQTVFDSGCGTLLPKMYKCSDFSMSSSMFFLIYFMIAILVSVTCYLFVALIYITLMTNDVEHIFICLLNIRYLKKGLLKFFGHILIELSILFFGCKIYLLMHDEYHLLNKCIDCKSVTVLDSLPPLFSVKIQIKFETVIPEFH